MSGENTGVLELTHTQFQETIAKAIREDREAREAETADREEQRDLQLSQALSELHTARVEKRLTALQSAGHAPAVLKVARAIYEADKPGRDDGALQLSMEEGADPVPVSASEIVDLLLSALPPTSLTTTNPVTARPGFNAPPTGEVDNSIDGIKARADALLSDLRQDSE